MAAARGFPTSSFSISCDADSDFRLKMDFCSNGLRFRNLPCVSVACFPRMIDDHLRLKHVVSETGSFKVGPRCQVAPSGGTGPKPSGISALELLKKSGANRYTRERSSIVVVGFNYHAAPIEIREKLSIPEAQWPQAIGELYSLNHIDEAALLSTCNRMEIYVVALSQHRGIKEVTEWMSKISSVPVSELHQHRFLLHNKEAVQHLFEVASGLDSLVLGEGQILAQVKQVVRTGQGIPGFGRKISGLFKHAITVGKRIRTETNISTRSVSVSSAAVELVMMKLPEISHTTARMLVVGAGKMGKLVIKHLAAKGCKKIVVVNRTQDRVASICEELKDFEIVYKPLSEILASAAEADAVFTCTASETILFSKDQVQMLPPVSSNIGGQRLFVDISVPRNVGPCVEDLENVKVYNVDDLKEVVASNKEDRLRKAKEEEAIIADEVEQFAAWKDSLETVQTIKNMRQYAENIRGPEVEKCLSKLGDNITNNQKKAIYDLSIGIVNQLLHGPMKLLRCDGADNLSLNQILENMNALNRIFGLDTDVDTGAEGTS